MFFPKPSQVNKLIILCCGQVYTQICVENIILRREAYGNIKVNKGSQLQNDGNNTVQRDKISGEQFDSDDAL